MPTQDGRYNDEQGLPRLQLAILDLTGEFHESAAHFNLGQAILCARRLGAMKTLLTGFLHGYEHKTWLTWCNMFNEHSGDKPSKADLHLRDKPLWWKQSEETRRPVDPPGPGERQWDSEEFSRLAMASIRQWEGETISKNPKHIHLHGKHVRPAYDGLTIEWREWGMGTHGYSAHENRIVQEIGPHSSLRKAHGLHHTRGEVAQ